MSGGDVLRETYKNTERANVMNDFATTTSVTGC